MKLLLTEQILHRHRYAGALFSAAVMLVLTGADARAQSLQRVRQSGDYEIHDSWQEVHGVGANLHTVQVYKVTEKLTGKGETMHFSTSGERLSESQRKTMRQSAYADRVHPRLRRQFTDLALKQRSGGATTNVTVWISMPESAVQELEQVAAVDDSSYAPEITDDMQEPAQLAQLAARDAQLETENTKLMQLRAEVSGKFSAVVESFVREIELRPEQIVYRYRYAPAIVLRLTLEEAEQIARSPLVNYLFGDEETKEELDIIAPASKAYTMWSYGYTGAGTKIAHVEGSVFGRMATENPYLAGTVVYDPAAKVGAHATACGGIIRNTHSLNKGIAYGCTLYNVNSVKIDTYTDVNPGIEWALDQGVTILNGSYSYDWSTNNNSEICWSDIHYDYIVHYGQVMFTMSAGNIGRHSGFITSPGRGYNILTVGNVDGKRTTTWADDVMNPGSSFVDPVTGGNKPEIAAYGTDVYSTTTKAPWIGYVGSGTSASAPLVAAFGGLCINRNPAISSWPQVTKAKIMVSGVAHNIEGDARMSDRDGAGCAKATAALAGHYTKTLYNSDFDANGLFEVPIDISLTANDTRRIVLVYTHPPSSAQATPDPSSYYKSDLDLKAYIGNVEVASSSYGERNPFEIIDYTPAASGVMRVKIRCYTWNSNVTSLRIGVAWGSKNNMGKEPDAAANDFFANAHTISGYRATVNSSNVGATKESGEPDHANRTGGKSMWWKWLPPASGSVTINTFGSDFDTLLGVYGGSNINNLTEKASNDDSDGTLQSQVQFNATKNVYHWIAVDGYNGKSGHIKLNLFYTPPENDNFADATTIPKYGGEITGTNLGATTEVGEPGHYYGSSKYSSVWWKWTPRVSGPATFGTDGSDFNNVLAIYRGSSLNNLTKLAYETFIVNGYGEPIELDVSAGWTYYIAVDGYLPNEYGNIKLNIVPTAPENDNFADATIIRSDGGWEYGTNIGATLEPGEPNHGGFHGGSSVWWKWTSPVAGLAKVDTLGSDFTSRVAVYRGSALNNLTAVAYNGGYQRFAEFQVHRNTTYHIAVDGGLDRCGDIHLNLMPPVPANDNFAAASTFPRGGGLLYGTLIGASREDGEPFHADCFCVRSVWWQWTAHASGMTAVEVYGLYLDPALGIYTGSAVNNLQTIVTNEGDEGLENQVQFSTVAGTTYMFAVACGYEEYGEFSLKITPPAPANDNNRSAFIVPVQGGQTYGTNIGATKEKIEPNHAGNSGGASVWWLWTPAINTPVTITTFGSDFDTLLAVYAQGEIASNDDADGTVQSKVQFQAAAGTTYGIAVDGKWGATGLIVLNIIVGNSDLVIESMTMQGDQLELTVDCSAFNIYNLAVEYRTNLVSGADWAVLQPLTEPAGDGRYLLRVPKIDSPSCFYRIVGGETE